MRALKLVDLEADRLPALKGSEETKTTTALCDGDSRATSYY
jgi:hypothetical protein